MTVRMTLFGNGGDPFLLAALFGEIPGVNVKPLGTDRNGETSWTFFDVEIDREAVREAEMKAIEKEAEP